MAGADNLNSVNNPAEMVVPRVQAAIAHAFGEEFRQTDPVIRPSQFADIQINAAMALAKKVGLPPRDAAARIVERYAPCGESPTEVFSSARSAEAARYRTMSSSTSAPLRRRWRLSASRRSHSGRRASVRASAST